MSCIILLLDLAMASKTFTTAEVLAFLEDEEDCEVDDREEFFMKGSDKEFDELDEVEYGINIFHITIFALHIPSLYCRD